MKIRCWTEGQPMSKFDQSIWSSTAPTFYQSPPTQKVRTPEVEFHVNFFNQSQFLHSSYELLAGSKLSYLNPGDSVEQKPGTNSHFLSADTSGIILKVHMSKNTQNSHGNRYTKFFGWILFEVACEFSTTACNFQKCFFFVKAVSVEIRNLKNLKITFGWKFNCKLVQTYFYHKIL